MLGFIFALFYAAYLSVAKSLPNERAFLDATGFLYNWYFWWTIILSVIVVLFAGLITVVGGAAGAERGRGPGAILGTILGGGLSLLMMFSFAVRRCLYMGGAFLLNTSLTPGPEGGWEWNTFRLVLGCVFLFIAFISKSRGTHQVPSPTSTSKS